ncbi:Ribosomal silencing factor RsfA [hydrothermal vent metagenome]|uniref:Ribosomal silencing factor RsfA n=1 Tax=hydrothermal vent metagenome TaxID=652676 RepID=A0A3B0U9Z7_9ZZZZ
MAEFANDSKAEDILVLDMRKIVNYCDYFVIASGTSDRHTRAIADNIEQELYPKGVGFALKQGRDKGEWICFDSGDVVLHVFQKQMREFYALEHLWAEAKNVPLKLDE